MSGRYRDYDQGSSRSTRDDSRTHKERWSDRESRERARGRDDERPRSRSPNQCPIPPTYSKSSRYSPESSSSQQRDRDYEDKRRGSSDWEQDSDEEVPAPPPPPRISKISIGFTKPIKMNLGATKSAPVKSKPTVASVFNADDDDDEPEEMPAEAKMRMRNIGRETPTSAGPNSFGKTKQGFCDAKKVFEKNLKQALETADNKPPLPSKFPQTIYKIKGP